MGGSQALGRPGVGRSPSFTQGKATARVHASLRPLVCCVPLTFVQSVKPGSKPGEEKRKTIGKVLPKHSQLHDAV
jgi:hypothetical protein